MQWLRILAAAVLSASGVGAVFWWLLKRWTDHMLTERLKEYESELELSNARVIEPLKADLRAAAAQREHQYRIIQEKRADIVAAAYSLLVQARRKVADYIDPVEISPGPTKEELAKPAFEAVGEFLSYFDGHRIYFTEYQCNSVDAFLKELRKAGHLFRIYYIPGERMRNATKRQLEDMFDKWPEIAEKFAQNVPRLEAAIREQFREILGVK